MTVTEKDLKTALSMLGRYTRRKVTAKFSPKTRKYSNDFLRFRLEYGKIGLNMYSKKAGADRQLTPLMSKKDMFDYIHAMCKGIDLKSRK
jgi:hypothetical protein